MNPRNEARRLRVIDLYGRYGNMATVAKIEGISRERVRQILVASGVRITRPTIGKHGATVKLATCGQMIEEDYLAGQSLASIAKGWKVLPGHVRAVLEARGVTIREPLRVRGKA
jgi:hypothetical protein